MIDFACKRFDLNEIIKCSLGITKAEKVIMDFFISNSEEFNSTEISKRTRLQLSTVQKALKKLHEKNILLRSQKNLDNGGYVFVYRANSKQEIRQTIKDIIRGWSEKVEKEVDRL